MRDAEHADLTRLAKYAGWSLLATIAIGILTSIFVTHGIDINLSADVEGTARNMLDAELRLRAKAYLATLVFALEAVFGISLFLLLRRHGRLLAPWSLLLSIAGAVLVLTGAVFTMNAAQIASDPAYNSLTSDVQKLMLTGLQATSNYTSFHLGLVVSTAANAGFFYLFLKSRLMPTVISAWGLFASLFVVFTIIARDFIPALGNNALTLAFMVSNLIALLSTGFYLGVRGVRRVATT
jgi:hypothetical protein